MFVSPLTWQSPKLFLLKYLALFSLLPFLSPYIVQGTVNDVYRLLKSADLRIQADLETCWRHRYWAARASHFASERKRMPWHDYNQKLLELHKHSQTRQPNKHFHRWKLYQHLAWKICFYNRFHYTIHTTKNAYWCQWKHALSLQITLKSKLPGTAL